MWRLKYDVNLDSIERAPLKTNEANKISQIDAIDLVFFLFYCFLFFSEVNFFKWIITKFRLVITKKTLVVFVYFGSPNLGFTRNSKSR